MNITILDNGIMELKNKKNTFNDAVRSQKQLLKK